MSKQFCKAKDKQIYDQFNKPLYLKGIGIGGWLLLEGYMIQSYKELDRPRRIKEHITKLVDAAYADAFFDQWVKRFFTTKDIDFLKEEGFNCIRIPIDYQFLFEASEDQFALKKVEEAFALLDAIIQYCHQSQMYVILDLHAAPGGQTGTNIDNSKNNHAELFQKKLYQEQTIYIWTELAKRYKEEEYILAYDLLNEPLPNWFSQYNPRLYPLYEEIIQAIRQVDPHHMITLEGLHWSTDLSIFINLPDDNILLQFHKYWSNPDQESIQEYLDLRQRFHVPLLMGEGGENNLEWYSSVFKMYQQLDISFAFWTYKKMELNNSLVAFQKPEKWQDFLQGEVSKTEAKQILNNLLESIDFDQCSYYPIVSRHIFQRDSFQTPAYAFDYVERNTKTQNNSKLKTSFRKMDGYFIANDEKQVIPPNFKQYNGEQVPKEEKLFLYLSKGESATYSFQLSHGGELAIQIIGDKLEKLSCQIDGRSYSHEKGFFKLVLKQKRHKLKLQANDRVQISKLIFDLKEE